MKQGFFFKHLNKYYSLKTSQRFGSESNKTKKVGLFSERRFLIFTKKGPIEITFKPIHYTVAIFSLFVGFTSILYWSAIGLYSAIDVAQKDIITEASANFDTLNQEIVVNNDNKDFIIQNDTSIYEDIEKNDEKFQSNIIIPTKEIKSKKGTFESSSRNNIEDIELGNSFSIKNNAGKKNKYSDSSNKNIKNFNRIEDLILNETPKTAFRKKNNNFKKEKDFDKKNNNTIALPPILNEKAKNYRFLASLDNEIRTMEEVFSSLKIELGNDKIIPLKSFKKPSPSTEVDSVEFLLSMKNRIDVISIYREALGLIPLNPPMKHYYVSSRYGKRKHPVTKKWRFHHGIDLAGTWQENIDVSADGIVVFAGYHGSFGKVIRIKHKFNIMTTYGHLAKIMVKKGQIVSEGMTIGKMGRTGRVSGAHLHYEISVNGKSINPAKFFKIGRKLLNRNSFKSIVSLE